MKKLLLASTLKEQNTCQEKEPDRERKYKVWEIVLIYTCLSLSTLLLAMLYYSHH